MYQRVCPDLCRAYRRVRHCCGSADHSSSTAVSSEESSGRSSSDILCVVDCSRTRSRWWRGRLPRQWGRHDAAPRAGGSGNGANRLGPPPASPPSGAEGPGSGSAKSPKAPRAATSPSTVRARLRVAATFRACQFFCVCGLEVGGDPVGVGGGELGEGLFPVGGELALDETGWGGAFAGGFALVLVALLGALVAVAGPLATVVQLRPRRRRVVTAVLGRPCAVGRSRTLWRWWRGHLPRQWGRHDAAPRGREALGTA